MLNKQQKFLLAAVFLCGWAFVVWWYSSLSHIYSDICQKNEYTGTKECTTYHVSTVIFWHIGEFLNYYGVVITAVATGFIAWFTYSLRNATNIHAGHMEQMLGITREIERAYLYPIVASGDRARVNQYIRECLVFYLDDISKNDTPASSLIHIPFKIKNYGKTPGTIYYVYAEVGFWPRTTGAQVGISIPESVLGANDETGRLLAQMNIGLSRNQVLRINAYTGYLALVGQFVFDDIWGNKYSTDFLFFWDKEIKRMTLRNLRTHEGTWNNITQTFVRTQNKND